MFPSRKIFIGLEDIASIIENYTLGFNSLGFDVFSVVNSQASICASPCDIVLKDHLPPLRRRMTMRQKQEYIQKRINLIRKVFEKAIKECDIFLFIWSSFFPDYSDLPILKELGKKIIFVFVGSDCRWRTAYNQDMLQHGLDILPPGFNDGEQQLKEITLRLIMAEKYAEYKTVPAYIINKDVSNLSETMVINAGKSSGIDVDMPVITEQGLVGYITSVTENTAKVQPIIDPSTNISATITTSRDSVIVRGILRKQ